MKKQLKLFPLLAVIIVGTFATVTSLFSSPVEATYVEGIITQNTTWTLVDSPFVVSKDVIVAADVTLTIEPGVEVRFGGNFSLLVAGTLYANGTQNMPITFTSNKINPEAGDWVTIGLSAGTQSTLAYSVVKYAQTGVTVENSSVTITNSELSKNSQNGITIINSTATIENSKIAENLGAGIVLTGDNQVTISNNTLRANEDGIILAGNSTSGVDITQNLVLLNTNSGINLDADFFSNIVILNNTLSSNYYGFYVSSSQSTYITNNSVSYNEVGIFYDLGIGHGAHFNDIYGNDKGMDINETVTVDATRNYWGDETGPYHASLNPYGKGNPVGGNGYNIDFLFFLTAPVGYINQRPVANLLSDTKVVRPNQTVTLFATTSSDDRHIDLYYFNFGDGLISGWTTLSVFVHKYSSVGAYNATVVVMDDFGVVSTNTARVRIDVQNFPSLKVSITSQATNALVASGQQVPITVYATNATNGAAMADANITLFSIVGGSFTPSYGLTNFTGHFNTFFYAPSVAEKTYVRITATASKNGYADGSNYEYLSVLPLLSVSVTANPNLIKSEEISNVTVQVTHNANPVANAAIRISSDSGGSFTPENGTTDANGSFKFTFKAPLTLTQLNATITATAKKTDYWDGTAQIKLTVDPKTLVVQVTTNPTTVESKALSNVIVHVTSDGTPVANATVSLSSNAGGNFSATTGKTDASGDFRFTFTAPETTTQVNVTITASVTKSGYVDGGGQTNILVNPVPSPQPSAFGLPLTTILLIAIPIAVVAIVAVLIKAKVIIITREED